MANLRPSFLNAEEVPPIASPESFSPEISPNNVEPAKPGLSLTSEAEGLFPEISLDAPGIENLTEAEIKARKGHARCEIIPTVNCVTKRVTLQAFEVQFFAGTTVALSPQWSNGVTGHQIIVTPPGTWSYEIPAGVTCDHLNNVITLSGSFFNGQVGISGPTIICPGIDYELEALTAGYDFNTYSWSPPNPTGGLTPYPLTSPGTYSLSVNDDFGCPFTANYTVQQSPPVNPVISGPLYMCPENDTVTLNVNPPFSTYLWNTGETTQSIAPTTPGNYFVTVTNQFGCQNIAETAISPNGVDDVAVSATALSICPGTQTTLSVFPPIYVKYNWSTGWVSPNLTVNQPGTYTVTVTNITGCTGTAEITIDPAATPQPQLAAQPVCPGATTTLSPTGGTFSTFAWSNGQNTSSVNVPAGNYSVTVADAAGCTGTASVNVPVAPVPTVDVTGPASLCAPQSAVLQAGSGFSSYAWSTGANSSSIQVSNSGTYTVTVTNASGCTGTDNLTFTSVANPAPQISAAPYACNGQFDLNAGSGFSTYLWSNGTSNQSLTASTTGTYGVTVTNAAGCSGTASFPVTIPQAPQVNINGVASLCPGVTGQLNATAGYASYNWSPGGNTPSITANSPGNYAVTVTDALGCTATNTTVVAPAPPLSPDIAGPIQICVNSSGQLSVAGSFTSYAWSNGQNTASISVSTANTYTVTVTDATGCTGTDTHILTVSTALIPSITPAPYACDSKITLSAGLGFTTYNWSSGGTSSSITANAPGPYSVTVTDATGCSGAANFTVTIPANPAVDVAGVANLCDGNSGQVNATTGFTQYSWSSGQNTPSINVSQSGNYVVTVTDANGCTATDNQQVTVHPLPTPAIAGPNSICIGNSATLNAGNYVSYNWSTGATSQTISANQDGNFIVTVTDANGCTAVTTHVLSVLAELTPFITPAPYNCDNKINLSASGGYTTYAWSNGAATQNTAAQQSGTYIVTVTDASGCTGTGEQAVNIPANPVVDVTGTEQICPGETGTLNATTGFASYEWTGGGATSSISVSTSGTYSVTVTDVNGCTDTDQQAVAVAVPPAPIISGPTEILCKQPTLELSTGNFVSYNWSNGSDEQTSTVTVPGNYTVTVTDANGCTGTDSQTIGINVTPPAAEAGVPQVLSCTINSLTLDGAGSSAGANFTYEWTTLNGNIVSGGNTLSPIVNAAGDYTIVVTNQTNGCTSTDQVKISQSADVPIATAGSPKILTCAVTEVVLSGVGSSAGASFSYTWSTTDGNIKSDGTTLNPTVDQPGTYVIQVLDNSNQCKSFSSVVVSEDIEKPVGDGGPLQTLTCTILDLDLAATITSSSSQNLTYDWSTANGQIISGATTLTPNVGAAGIYVLTITDNGNGCTGTLTAQVQADANLPNAIIAQPQILTCDITQITLNANGSSSGANFTLDWTTQGGNIVSGGNTLQPVVDDPGTYTLQITDNTNSCKQTATITVDENVDKPIADAGQTVELNCKTTSLQLDGSGSSGPSGFSYAWTTTNGNISGGANTVSPTINQPGVYSITVKDLANGCTQTNAVQVTQNIEPPVVTIAQPDILTCDLETISLNGSGSGFGTSPTFTWTASGGGNIIGGASTASPDVDQPGTYTFNVLNNSNGCQKSTQVVVTEDVAPPSVGIDDPEKFDCNTSEVTIQATVSPNTFVVWKTTDGQIVSGANSTNPVVSKVGTYTVTVTANVNGCETTSSVDVLYDPTVPTGLEIDLDAPDCKRPKGKITFTSIAGGTQPFEYSIDGGENFQNLAQFSNITPGQYTLFIQDANGCTLTQELDIPEPIEPSISILPEFVIKMGDSTELEADLPPFPAGFIDTVIWKPLDGLVFEGFSIPELLRPIAKPLQTTTYTCIVRTPEGCEAEARTIVKVVEPGIYAPNVITPTDPDGENNIFLIFAEEPGFVKVRELSIYDRWGEQVFFNENFAPNDRSHGWNGAYKERDNNPAVFVWYAVVERIDGKLFFVKGDVTVLR